MSDVENVDRGLGNNLAIFFFFEKRTRHERFITADDSNFPFFTLSCSENSFASVGSVTHRRQRCRRNVLAGLSTLHLLNGLT